MAIISRTTGNRTVLPQGDTTVQSLTGLIQLVATTTNVSDTLVVDQQLIVGPKITLDNQPTEPLKTIIVGDDAQANVANPYDNQYDPQSSFGPPSDRNTASVYIPGGLGIEKDLNVGGFIYGRVAQATSSTAIVVAPSNANALYYPVFSNVVNDQLSSQLFGDKANKSGVLGSGGLTYNPYTGKLSLEAIQLSSTASSLTTASDNAVYIQGGAAIAKSLLLGGDLFPTSDNEQVIGSSTANWAEAYLEKVYTKLIASENGPIQISPGNGLTEIVGDIRISGQKPVGTAPVVTNILYVTEDGNDTNDGRAQDTSRACRTITGAVASPYYQPGTQIRVAPGHYLEDNPIRLKPYTSIVGADLRTTSVEPINKTQDLFHIDSGCYLAQMQFTNGRSGVLEGQYRPELNRGAYAVAFPPLTGTDRIDLFHSPYVQNCTNQSGPWLKDGTMFVPNYTIQVPSSVGTSSWVAGTSTLTVTMSLGQPLIGDSINVGPVNQGFFNARTLLLANKSFLQEQVVNYVDTTFSSGTFTYSVSKCQRDIGLIVDSIATDVMYNSTSESTFAGLQYWEQSSSSIPGEISTTTEAITYLQLLASNVAGTSGTTAEETAVALLFDKILDIINNGTVNVTDQIVSNGLPSTVGSCVDAYNALLANKLVFQNSIITWIGTYYPDFVYNVDTCRRDVGYIIDAVAFDLLHGGNKQSTKAGVYYYNFSTTDTQIPNEIPQTTAAYSYIKNIVSSIVRGEALPTTYQTAVVQNFTGTPATLNEAMELQDRIDVITQIIRRGPSVAGTKMPIDPTVVPTTNATNAFIMLEANRAFIQAEVLAYIGATAGKFYYAREYCYRDVGILVENVSYDAAFGGNEKSVQSGLAYFNGVTSRISGQESQTIAAIDFLNSLAQQVISNTPCVGISTITHPQVINTVLTDGDVCGNSLASGFSIITDIINNGPDAAPEIYISGGPDAAYESAEVLLQANRTFIQENTINYINWNNPGFTYNQALCYRDTGLIIDAVSQDILLGGNSKSLEAGLAYWNQGYNYVAGQESTTTMAINYARDLALQVIANSPITAMTGTTSTQIINPFFQYGGDYMPQQAVARNFNLITNIIQNGVLAAPPRYQGSSLSLASGALADDVRLAPKILSVTPLGGDNYTLTLNTTTTGIADNATLYFGNAGVLPIQDEDVPDDYASRKLDPVGAMGGCLVDGSVVSDRSPIQSFVFDAYTQVNQGGIGIKVTNNGYAQLVSVFTIFCSVGVQVDNGGIASIVNSNANFGDVALIAKGHGYRAFSGTVYNPPNKAYPDSPGPDGLNQFYPTGYWPSNAQVEIFVPDVVDRPHISLVMEVEPPKDYVNPQVLPGFLNAIVNTGTLTTGTITISGININSIAVGNTLHIRDQFGSFTGTNGLLYSDTGTVVTDVSYQSITLSKSITSGGGDPADDTYFNLYFCGNAYYTVLSSSIANNPKPVGTNILSSANVSTGISQISAHITSLSHLNTLVESVISNITITGLYQTTSTQVIQKQIVGGSQAIEFIGNRFTDLKNIIGAANINSANAVVSTNNRKKTGNLVPGAGSAVDLITANIDFLAEEISAYVNSVFGPTIGAYDNAKCRRDVKLTLQRLIYDIETGGNYNMVMSGLSYWSRNGTHHIVSLGENVTDTSLFPDGATINFYQRSYISASSYVFEYVGAGTNYGALPQVGRRDPIQSKETLQLDNGKVFFTSTDQNGDFRIGTGLVISQATGLLSGRTFQKSLLNYLTPFILAIGG
jgi:hypothetical protein